MSYSSEVLADSPRAYWRLGDPVLISAISASSSFSSLPAWQAFDNTVNPWTTNGTSSGWLQAQLTSAVALTSYSILREDYLSGARAPKDWTFQGSNNGSTWTTLDTRSGITWPTAGETKTFTFTNSTAYSYYRLNVTANNGDSFLSVPELTLGSTFIGFLDSSGNNRHAYLPLPLGVTPGTSGALNGDADTAMTFNGTSGQATVPYASWMDASTAITVEAWVKTSSTAIIPILDRDSSAGRVWQFRLNAGKVEFIKTGGTGGVIGGGGTSTINNNAWHHVAATYDGSNIRIYVDGVLEATSAAVGNLGTGSSPFAIGAGYGGTGSVGFYFAGSIDEAAVYPAVLSGTRIAAHYTAGTTAANAASGTASLSLTASGGAGATGAGSAALSLSASGSTSVPAGGSASLSLSASGALVPPVAASGSAALSLSASGGASGAPGGTASLNLIATGTALAVLAASGSATLTLTASGSAVMSAGGTAVLTLSAGGVALALYETDTSNALDGLDLLLTATVIFPVPVATPPASVAAMHYDKALAYPTPTMVGGRPT